MMLADPILSTNKFREAKRVHAQTPGDANFERDLAGCLINGCVHSVGDVFIAARAVDLDAPPEDVMNPEMFFKEANAWYIHIAVAPRGLGTILALIPFDLPFVAYEHRGRLRYVSIHRFKKCPIGPNIPAS